MFLAVDLPSTELRNRALKALNDADVLGLASGERAIRFRPSVSLTARDAKRTAAPGRPGPRRRAS
jgi:hypothetical protein